MVNRWRYWLYISISCVFLKHFSKSLTVLKEAMSYLFVSSASLYRLYCFILCDWHLLEFPREYSTIYLSLHVGGIRHAARKQLAQSNLQIQTWGTRRHMCWNRSLRQRVMTKLQFHRKGLSQWLKHVSRPSPGSLRYLFPGIHRH